MSEFIDYSPELKAAIAHAKAGQNITAAYQKFTQLFDEGKLEVRQRNDYGWLIYYALKQARNADALRRKQMLNNYLKLQLPKPSMLHSLILSEAVTLEKNIPLEFRIRDFMRLWGWECLREDDWTPFVTDDGKTMSSLVEKLISVYVKELKTDGVVACPEFCQVVDAALVRYPKNQYMPKYKATVLLSQGKRAEALDYYKVMIMQSPAKQYLWEQAAELVDNMDTKIALLCKAVTCGADEEFIGKIRMSLAHLLVAKGLRNNAKYELEKYRITYESKKYHLKAEFQQAYNQLADVAAAESNDAVYAEYFAKADEFIYSALPTELAVKVNEKQCDDHKHPGRKLDIWYFKVGQSTRQLRKPSKFGLPKRMANGATFDVKLHEGKIVWIKQHVGPITASWIKVLSGEVTLRTDRNGKPYAIVADSYIGANLLQHISNGQTIKFLALKQDDGRWGAISLL